MGFLKDAISMLRGDKSLCADKQKHQVKHIEAGYEKRGVSKKEAKRRARATVNQQDCGGKKSGSGRNASPGKVGGK